MTKAIEKEPEIEDEAASEPRRGRGRIAVRLQDAATKPPRRMEDKKNVVEQTTKRRGDEVRNRILKAALECFGAFGFDGTSTRAIAERADVTHTLVLYHFGSKEDLWTATMDSSLAAYLEAVAVNLENDGSRRAGDVLRTFIEQFVRLSAQYPQIHRIMTMEGNQDTPRLKWVIDHYLRDHFTKVRDVIRRAQDDGEVRDCDAARLYYYIIGGGGTLFTLSTEYRELTGRDVFSETEILRNIAFLFDTVFLV